MSGERPEYSVDERQAVLIKVKGYWTHRASHQHILDDARHPDFPAVKNDMKRYRQAVIEILRIRTKELKAGSHGGFEYREDLRTAEGMADLLRDEFDELFREIEEE